MHMYTYIWGGYDQEAPGRAAARCNAPKLPRAIRVGPNQGEKIWGGVIREFIQSFYPIPGVHLIFRLKFRGFIGDKKNPNEMNPRNLSLKFGLNPGIRTLHFCPPPYLDLP